VITGKIPFSGSFIFTDGANFVGGDLDDVGMTTGMFRIDSFATSGEWSGHSYFANVSFRANGFFSGASKPYFAYPSGSGRPFGPFGTPGTTSIEGTIQMTPRALGDLKKEIQVGRIRIPGMDRTAVDLSRVCVHDIGMNVGRLNFGMGGTIQGGKIVLWLNGTNAYTVLGF